jgi:hypothetical protein
MSAFRDQLHASTAAGLALDSVTPNNAHARYKSGAAIPRPEAGTTHSLPVCVLPVSQKLISVVPSTHFGHQYMHMEFTPRTLKVVS